MCGTKGLVCRSGAILERCSAARLLEATLARHYAASPPPPSQPPSSQPTGSAAQPVTGSWAPRSSKYTLEPVAAVVAWLLARRRRLAYAWILHATCYRRPCVGCVLPARAGGIWSLLRMLRAPSSRCPVPQRPSEKKAGGGGRHGLAVARHGIGASGTIGHAQRALFLENRWRSRHLAWGSHTPIIAVEKSLVVAY